MNDPSQFSLGGLIQMGDRSILLDPDMLAYLEYEANRRGISVAAAYREELLFERIARREALTTEECQTLARLSEPKSRLIEGEEECPF